MYNNYDDEYNWERRSVHGRNPMSTAAVVLGIVSIVSCSAFYVSLPCGALAVICAILSRDNRPMVQKSKAGIVCGIIGMVATLVITVSTLRYVLTTENGRAYLQYYYQMYTGDFDFDVDEALGQLFPFLYDSEDGNSENSENGSDDPGSEDREDSDSGSDDGREPGSDHDGFDDGGSGDQPGGGGSSPQQNDSAEEGGFI